MCQSNVLAQSKDLDKGERFFSKKEYALAIPHLKKYVQSHNDKPIKRKLLQCYLENNLDNQAIILLKEMVNVVEAEAIDFLNYATLLKKLHKYDQAILWYKKYHNLKPADKNVLQLIQSFKLINELTDDSLFIAKSININSLQTDYASTLYKDGIILVSGRPNKQSKRINRNNTDHYFNLYFSKNINGDYSKPALLSDDLNTKYHEGSASFSANEQFIYFSRNKGIVDLNGKAQLNIYMSRFNKGKWDKPELFQHAGEDYSTGHPSISKDGQLIFFISNMPGGYGGTDIYYCRKQGFVWGPPINLGPKINTSGNEMFPYINDDKYLYFASSGHVGFGGLDIFKSTFEQNNWSFPINIGFPFNSPKDDFGYIYDHKKKLGYFSSNRNGSDDIFEFEKNKAKLKSLNGKISVMRAEDAIDSVKVILMEKNSIEAKTHTDNTGRFKFEIFKDKDYSLIVQKPNYKTKRVLYIPQGSDRNKNVQIKMEQSPWATIKAFVKNQFSTKPIKGAKVEVVNKTYKLRTFCTTDANGNFTLNVDPGNHYDLIVTKTGYYTKIFTNYSHDDIQSIDLIKSKGNQTIELYSSTFSDESWLLSEITKGELNNIIEILNHNHDILIEIRASTKLDNGNKKNKALCSKRANEAANYMISQGIPANRIKTKAMGLNIKSSSIAIKLVETF